MKMVALIPARAGSKRIVGKNTRLLAGEPLIAWTIRAALESGVFSKVIVSSEDTDTLAAAEEYGAELWRRNEAFSTDDAPDICWVREILGNAGLNWWIETPNAFAILRPTSPFRTADTIRRAYKQFRHDEAHSLRAMQPVKEHPGKMWQVMAPGYPAMPLIGIEWPARGPGAQSERTRDTEPWHSLPTQTLPKVYVQNASLEMAWSYVIPAFGTISGRKVSPFFTEGYEGFDLNTEDDWQEAERLIEQGKVALPSLARL